jgi:hypothetical protein
LRNRRLLTNFLFGERKIQVIFQPGFSAFIPALIFLFVRRHLGLGLSLPGASSGQDFDSFNGKADFFHAHHPLPILDPIVGLKERYRLLQYQRQRNCQADELSGPGAVKNSGCRRAELPAD